MVGRRKDKAFGLADVILTNDKSELRWQMAGKSMICKLDNNVEEITVLSDLVRRFFFLI